LVRIWNTPEFAKTNSVVSIAGHVRRFERGVMLLEPLHYLPTMERKPGIFDRVKCSRKRESTVTPIFNGC